MSSRRCNFCTVWDFRKMAAARRDLGHVVTTTPAPLPGFPHGVDVHVHPPDYTPSTRVLNPAATVADYLDWTPEPVGEWWVAWMARIPEACCCHE